LDSSVLETWLWEAAYVLRGPVNAPKFKASILPLASLKRLSDVLHEAGAPDSFKKPSCQPGGGFMKRSCVPYITKKGSS
jgi:hypothetical protein